MSLALLALLALAQEGLVHPRPADARSARVWSERAGLFFEAWAAAPSERRAAVELALESLLGPGAPLDRRPNLSELALLRRVLAGEDLARARADELAHFADALDLRLAPGYSRSGAEEGPLTVFATCLGSERVQGALELTLTWTDPDGRVLAVRHEPFEARQFELEVPLYLRTPLAPVGRWLLCPSVTQAGETRLGVAQPFHVLEDTAVLSDEARSALEQVAAGRAPRTPFLELTAAGARFEEHLEHVPGGLLWRNPGEATLLFLPPREEDAAHLLCGELGRRWREFAAQNGLSLAVHDPASGLELTDFLGALAERGCAAPWLVARGDSARMLAQPGARELALAGLVVVGSLARPGANFPAVPTLMLHTRPCAVSNEGRVEHLPAGRAAFLCELELPERLGPWLARQRQK